MTMIMKTRVMTTETRTKTKNSNNNNRDVHTYSPKTFFSESVL
jgi:hypothetical protein